jgi:hypothetical protein
MANIYGNGKGNFIEGTLGNDVIRAKGGNDNVWGNGGNDKIYLNGGDDTAHYLIEESAGYQTKINGGRGDDEVVIYYTQQQLEEAGASIADIYVQFETTSHDDWMTIESLGLSLKNIESIIFVDASPIIASASGADSDGQMYSYLVVRDSDNSNTISFNDVVQFGDITINQQTFGIGMENKDYYLVWGDEVHTADNFTGEAVTKYYLGFSDESGGDPIGRIALIDAEPGASAQEIIDLLLYDPDGSSQEYVLTVSDAGDDFTGGGAKYLHVNAAASFLSPEQAVPADPNLIEIGEHDYLDVSFSFGL